VIGISVDPAKRNKAFADELHITFPVLSDESKAVTREYGVLYPLIRVARRVTFVIDRQGVIREITEGGEAADPAKTAQSCSVLPPQ
jgi:peroxiredoxin Q/BCP